MVGRLIAQCRFVIRNDSPRQGVRCTVDFMKQRLHKHLTVLELAQLANCFCSHDSARFRDHLGFPPLDYYLQLKFQRACELLDTTPWPIKRIAHHLGFEDPLYFREEFGEFRSYCLRNRDTGTEGRCDDDRPHRTR